MRFEKPYQDKEIEDAFDDYQSWINKLLENFDSAQSALRFLNSIRKLNSFFSSQSSLQSNWNEIKSLYEGDDEDLKEFLASKFYFVSRRTEAKTGNLISIDPHCFSSPSTYWTFIGFIDTLLGETIRENSSHTDYDEIVKRISLLLSHLKLTNDKGDLLTQKPGPLIGICKALHDRHNKKFASLPIWTNYEKLLRENFNYTGSRIKEDIFPSHHTARDYYSRADQFIGDYLKALYN